MRERLVAARVSLRERQNKPRRVPAFLVIGAMKAGTTSLFRYLMSDPRFVNPVAKEVHYFDYNWVRSTSWYLAHFPRRRSSATEIITGEASPSYLVHPRAAARAKKVLPSAKIIALLRDPLQRALSHYHHEVRLGREHRPALEAMRSPDAQATFSMSTEEECLWYDTIRGRRKCNADSARLVAENPMNRAYITYSLYADQLTNWFDAYGRDQVLVLRSEDLFQTPEDVLRNVFAFLGLEYYPQKDIKPHNTGRYSRSIPPSVVEYLEENLSEPNQRLLRLLGPKFTWSTS